MPQEPVRVWNPPNPYLTEHRELLGEPPAAELEVYEDHSSSILSSNDSPDLGFRYSVNPYRGCWHACSYCIHGDTLIALTNGRHKPISDIRVGDEIYGTVLRNGYHRLTKTRVLAHWLTFKPAHRIILEDGTELVASADHRFLTHRGWKYVTGSEQGRARRPHLTTNNRLLGIGKITDLPCEDDEYRRGYLCGMIRGDGLLASYNYNGRRREKEEIYQFRLALIDLEALQRTQQYLCALEVPTRDFIFQQATQGRQLMRGIRTSARAQVGRIRDLIRWPAEASPSWSKGFLAGIFDAEGTHSRGILRICNTDRIITERIMISLRQLGFDCIEERRTIYQTDKPIYIIRVRGGLREHLRFFQAVDPAISRKKEIAGQAIKNQTRRVVSIESLGLSMAMYDITTGTADFIANGVVSHNCYARRTHEYFGLGAGTDFERKIFVKKEAPALLEEAFRKKSWKGETLVFSGVTDCYQPLEAAWKLTRGCLEVCAKYRNPVSIITKSALIRRDVDLLQELHRRASVRVNLSIAFLDEGVARLIEPGTPTIARRFETMEILARAGIPVSIGIAPIIPGLNDRDAAGLLRRAKECGATGAFHTLLRLPGSVRDVFLRRLQEKLPLKYEHVRKRILDVRGGKLYDGRFFERRRGHGAYWEAFNRTWEVWTDRLGFNRDDGDEEEKKEGSTFRRPPQGGQMEFGLE